MQIVDDEDATLDQFSMSVVGKPMNTLGLAPIVFQLFQGNSRTLLSSHILEVSDEKQIESDYIRHSWPADYLRRVTAEFHVCSLDRLITSPGLADNGLEYISCCHQNMFGNNIERSDASSELQVSSVRRPY